MTSPFDLKDFQVQPLPEPGSQPFDKQVFLDLLQETGSVKDACLALGCTEKSAYVAKRRDKKFSEEWIKPGHTNGDNTHNVSATISVDKNRIYHSGENPYEEKDEWQVVGEWMWKNREVYNGLSVLPYFGGSYKQAPFEDISELEYLNKVGHLKSIDLSNVVEIDDSVDFGQVAACAGGACEIS